ncbi:hypothetical protein ACRAWF_28910 [Streptomyces sp. L7]
MRALGAYSAVIAAVGAAARADPRWCPRQAPTCSARGWRPVFLVNVPVGVVTPVPRQARAASGRRSGAGAGAGLRRAGAGAARLGRLRC